MKHTTILYTCMGLMGAAAVTGFAEYQSASRKGELKNLYSDNTTGSGAKTNTIDLDDYSRAPIEPQVAEAPNPPAKPAKPARPKKLPPPPPPPLTTSVHSAPNVPPTAEINTPEAPAINEKPEAPPAIDTATEITVEEMPAFFSRAPLPPKKKHKRVKGQ